MTNRYIFKYILVIILFVFANQIVLAQQKITFHTDRDYYFPGDTIWYKTYIHLNGKLDTSIHNLLVAFGKENTEILEQQLRQVNWGLCYGQYVLPIDYESSDVYINIFSKRNISEAEIVTPESFKLAVIQKKNVPTSDEANLIIQVEGNGWLPNALNKMVFHWNSKDVVEAKLVDQEGKDLEMLKIDRYAKAFTEIKSSSNQVYVHWKSKDKSYLDTVPSLKSNIRMRVSEESDTTFVYIENQSDLSSVNFQYEQGNYILLDTILTLEKNQIIKLSMQDLLIGRFMGNFLLKNKNQLLSKISFHPKVKDSLKIEPEHLLFRPYAPQRLALEMPGNEEWNLSVSIVDGLIPNSMLKNQKANYQFETSRHVFHYESQDKLMNYSGELYDPIANLTGKIIMEDQQWKKFMELRKEREERMKKRKKEFRAVSFGIKKVAHINYVYRVVDFDSLGNLILPNMTFQDTFQTRVVQIDDRLKTINYELEWKFSPLPSLKQLTIPDYLKNLDLSTQYLGRYDPNTYSDEFGETIIKSIGINRKIKESIHKD